MSEDSGRLGGKLPILSGWAAINAFRFIFVLVSSFVLGSPVAWAQPKSGLRSIPQMDPLESAQKGRALVADLLAQRPQGEATNAGLMKIRDGGGNQREVPIKFAVVPQGANWLNTYEAAPAGEAPGQLLTILHSNSGPNRYWLTSGPGSGASLTNATTLGPEQTMVPFAKSDFWVADLGLEFLHWPQQLLLKQEMRRSRSCNVLASINPEPRPGSYSRVVSWLDIESGGIVLAQAFDARDRLLKEFAPKEMKKIQGQWQLEEMEIKNTQTGSRTRVQFDLDH
jgi:hypothetical protein